MKSVIVITPYPKNQTTRITELACMIRLIYHEECCDISQGQQLMEFAFVESTESPCPFQKIHCVFYLKQGVTSYQQMHTGKIFD